MLVTVFIESFLYVHVIYQYISNFSNFLFQFNSNLLEHWPDIDELKFATRIQTVYFEHNPIQKDPMYRKKIKLSLPSLTQIDATLV